MKVWYSGLLDTDRHMIDVTGSRIRIGRGAQNDVVLNSPLVPLEAVVLYKRERAWELICLALTGIQIGDQNLSAGDRYMIETSQAIRLGPFSLMLDLPKDAVSSEAVRREELDQVVSEFIRAIHIELLSRMDLEVDRDNSRQDSDEYLLTLERHLDAISQSKGLFSGDRVEQVEHIAGHCVRGQVLESVATRSGSPARSVLQSERHWSRIVSAVPQREDELGALTKYMVGSLKISAEEDLTSKIDCVDQTFWSTWNKTSGNIHADFIRYLALRYLKKEIKDIVFGYGPLEDLLRLPTISEIMVVDRDRIYIEKNGVVENSGRRFISDAVTLAIIERIVSKVSRRIDKSRPLVDARLADGSRVNAVIPPLAVSGPCLTIRKFPERRLLVDDLVAKGALNRTAAEFCRAAVISRRNILISGGTGTGKTTLLNCLSDFIPDKERIVTIEDTAELQLSKEHVVRMETKESNIEGAGEYTIRDLVRNALRMRPDRIVVGECRGPEALDMLQAMNTGHDGSLTTIHANSSEDVILRLEVLVQMAADLPVDSIHRQIASAIDLIVQLQRMRNGRRCVSQITEVIAVDPITSQIQSRDLFSLEDSADSDASLCATGHLPTFMEELVERELIALESFFR